MTLACTLLFWKGTCRTLIPKGIVSFVTHLVPLLHFVNIASRISLTTLLPAQFAHHYNGQLGWHQRRHDCAITTLAAQP